MKKVVLIGYMGSGKSVVSAMLAQKIGIEFVELDESIEKKCGMSVATIFATKGELYFRKVERELFLEFLQNTSRELIISTGGGTPCYYNNHELLQAEGVVSVYLKASVAALTQRLDKEKSSRPLLAHLSTEELSEFIAKHLFDRSFYYNQATFKISVDAKSVEEIVNEIATLLV
ncbi:shikimate kinase [Flavobacterium sp.]|jgi:shikimate kinase|uniref:shikimate kinase n=1 Tax=Flavobacterium sp. TaxID=239 RepID=UPI0037C18D35